MGLGLVTLAEPTLGVGPGCVEIAQRRPVEPAATGSGTTLCVFQDALGVELGLSIRVHRCQACSLGDGLGLGLAVDRGA